jgi:glycosyltransferase involved in cell wall biosynthesis
MNVAFMGRSLRGRYSGVVRYTDELVRALAPRLKGDLSVFLTRAADGLDGVDIRRVRAPFPTPNEYARGLWEQTVVPIEVARLRFDVYHSPNYILPVALRCPAVVTVHDIAFLDRTLHRLTSHLYLSVLTRWALNVARRIICVSAHTGDLLAERFPSTRERIRVISEGVDERFTPQPDALVKAFRERFGLDRAYVLFVGTQEPRKNLDRLIKAYELAVERTGSEHLLAIAGVRGWKDEAVQRALHVSPARDRIRLLGYVPDELLPAAYAGADAFVYPSLLEGFGLPPLEAMACGAPVLTSNTSSLPEVVGDAALTVDPLNAEEIAIALQRLMCDRELRLSLAASGRMRSELFRWDRVAEQTMAVYAEAAG